METDFGGIESKLEDYDVIEEMRRGPLGSTHLLLNKIDDKKYVLKKVRLAKLTDTCNGTSSEQMKMILKLKNPYILEYKDAWVDKENYLCIITCYCEGGDMAARIKKGRGALFSEEKVCKWLTQLLLAVDYLHSQRVRHGDLKCSNIFLTKDNDIQLGDFGLAKLLTGEDLASSAVRTPNNMCPELLAHAPYGYKSDIWSLSCCMFDIAAHQPAFRAPDMAGLINKINRSCISTLPIVYSPALKQIIKSMLRKNPEHRPTAAELLRNPHLQPYLLRCQNLSTVYLPIISTNSPKEKTGRRKSFSPKSSTGNDNIKKEVGMSRKLETLYQLPPHSDKPMSMSSAEDNLETKRVDPTSYNNLTISSCTDDSKDMSMESETSVCKGDTEPTKGDNLVEIAQDSPDERQQEEETLADDFQERLEVDVKALTTKDQETSTRHQILEETKGGTDLEEQDNKLSTSNIDCSSNQGLIYDQTQLSAVNEPNAEAAEPPSSTENIQSRPVMCTEGTSVNSSSSEGNDTLKCSVENGVKPDHESSSMQGVSKGISLAPSDISLLKKITKMADDESKHDWENPSQERADALESLLELCARLLKQEKLGELAGVLGPFGGETVSSRETAIWLTKSLMSAQKFNQET